MLPVIISTELTLIALAVKRPNSSARNRISVNNTKLECGPMPKVMAALANIGGALCSTPQSLADAQCYSAVQ